MDGRAPLPLAELIERYEQAGVDQLMFAAQIGRNRHEDICAALQLFARTVLPRFAAEAEARDAAKRERLAPACAHALARRAPARPAPLGYVVTPEGEPAPA